MEEYFVLAIGLGWGSIAHVCDWTIEPSDHIGTTSSIPPAGAPRPSSPSCLPSGTCDSSGGRPARPHCSAAAARPDPGLSTWPARESRRHCSTSWMQRLTTLTLLCLYGVLALAATRQAQDILVLPTIIPEGLTVRITWVGGCRNGTREARRGGRGFGCSKSGMCGLRHVWGSLWHRCA